MVHIKGRMRITSVGITLLLILFISFLQLNSFVSRMDHPLFSDMETFFNRAQTLNTCSYGRPIGHSLFLSVVFKIFGVSRENVYFSNIVLTLLSIGLIFYLGLKISGLFSGIIAAFIFAFSEESLVLNGLILTEILQNTLFLLCVVLIFKQLEKKYSLVLSICTGLAISFLVLTKSALIFLILPFFIPIFFRDRLLIFRDRRYFVQVLSLVLVFFVVIFSYGLFNYIVKNRFVMLSTNGPINFYIGNNDATDGRNSGAHVRIDFPPNMSERDREKEYVKRALEFRRKNPKKVIEITKIRIINWWTQDPNQDGLYSFINAKQHKESFFLLRSSFILKLGMPLLFVFMWMSFLQGRKVPFGNLKNFNKNMVFSGVAIFCVYLLGFFTLKNQVALLLYFGCLAVASGLAFLSSFFMTITNFRVKEIHRLCLIVGFFTYSALYTLFFFIKIRFRFPMISLYSLIIGIVIAEIISVFVKMAGRARENKIV